METGSIPQINIWYPVAMKLVLAVIQDADATALIRVLSQHAFDVTKLASTGGFLREGNTTLMIGLDDERMEELKRHIQQTCRTRTRLVAPSVSMGEQNEGLMSDPVEVPVRGRRYVCFGCARIY